MAYPSSFRVSADHVHHDEILVVGDRDRLTGIPRNNWLDMNCYNYKEVMPSPFIYGLLCSSPTHSTDQIKIFCFVAALTIIVSVFIKRRSAQPGGRIYQYNQGKIYETISNKRRRLRDMLNDPVLVRDMERRYGDLTSLRESVQQWELDCFAVQKKECDQFLKVGGELTVPWIKSMNVSLVFVDCLVLYLNFNPVTSMILLGSLVHQVDNMLLLRAVVELNGKERGGKSRSNNDIAVVGVPVPDVDVGVPVGGKAMTV